MALPSPNLDGWLAIGRIVAPQGLRGELRVYPSTDFPERFEEPGQRWLLRPGQTEPQAVQLVEGYEVPGKGLYVVKLAEVSDRNQAEALRDSLLLVPESDRPPLEADEFHVVDLLGLSVIEQATQTLLGTVKDVIPAGNDLLEVQLDPAWVGRHAPAPEAAETLEPETDTESKGDRKARPRKAKPPTVLIPFVKEIVPVVDLVQKRLEVVPPPGLLEINR